MKKINKLSLTMLLSAGLILGACSATDTADESSESAATETVTYTTVDGEEIEDKLMQKIRYLDKLIDELAKGKSMEKILRK